MTASSSPTASFDEIGAILRRHKSFALVSHIRPDGDAVGSLLGLGRSLQEMGKSVVLLNENGLPESYGFLPGSEAIRRPGTEPVEAEVAIALDTATRPRLGEGCLAAISRVPLLLNLDHHISNPGYGDLNHIDASAPATGQILYELLVSQEMPLPPESRDALYVAISTDTGSFQYPSTTARTYEIAADLVRRGVAVGPINSLTYNNHPYRRVELLRALLASMELSAGGRVAHWSQDSATSRALDLRAGDSEGLIDILRGIRGVVVAVFFEELPDGASRVSLRSKDARVDVCEVAAGFGGGGHPMAAGIRMKVPLAEARGRVLAALEEAVRKAGL